MLHLHQGFQRKENQPFRNFTTENLETTLFREDDKKKEITNNLFSIAFKKNNDQQ